MTQTLKKKRQRGSLLDRHGNLTGGQVATICDSLLYAAIEPLYLRTSVLEELPYTLLNLTQVYPRRKLSTQDNQKFMASLSRAVTEDRDTQWETLKRLGIERFVWLKLALQYLRETGEPYVEAYHRAITDPVPEDVAFIRECEGRYGCDLYAVTKHLISGIQVFLRFRDAVAEQFMALAVQGATAMWNRRTKPVALKDLIQLMMIAIAKTLDRYTSEKGALTSYFRLWMKSSYSQSSIIEGLAYDVPASVRHKQALGTSGHQNFAISLDNRVGEDGESTIGDLVASSAPTPEEWVEQRSAEARMLKLIKLADHNRTFRVLNSIAESFNDMELVLLDQCAVNVDHARFERETPGAMPKPKGTPYITRNHRS